MSATVHIVPHTHWDREWYHSQARFGLRLARLVDDVLERLESGTLPSFLLDGQAVLLDDYAELRKSGGQGDRGTGGLKDALASGKLECGPWYVLADNLTVGGEALVRNLLEGGRAVRRYGGKPMMVGYAPDAFGHPAILPTLFAGFGIRTAVTWRGFGGARGHDKDLWMWRGPDGAEVLMIHLPPPGYEYGANLPVAPAAARRRWRELDALLAPRARAPHWLVMNGADHHAAQTDVVAAMDMLELLAPDHQFLVGSLGGYAQAVQQWARGHGPEIPTVEGELRDGRRHAWALQGTLSSRVYLKQNNAECQRLLERVVEPLAALAATAPRPDGRRVTRRRTRGEAPHADLRAELQAAWRTLLENHPHDSICGTSTDAVHREMLTRFVRCRDQGSEIAQRAVDIAVGHDADAARVAGRSAWRPALVLFNPAPHKHSGVVEVDVERFAFDVPVGPGSAGGWSEQSAGFGPLIIKDAAGRRVPHQEIGTPALESSLTESPRHYPDCDAVLRTRVALAVRDLPPAGLRALRVDQGRLGAKASVPRGPVRVTSAGLENDLLRVRVEADGTFAMARIGGGWNAHGLGRMELKRDDGDSYTSAPRGRDLLGETRAEASEITAGGPLVGELRVWRRHVEPKPLRREVVQQVDLRVHAGEPFVRLTIPRQWMWPNLRLRLGFSLGERPARVVADGPFGPVEREAGVAHLPRAGETEATPATAPLQRYVSVAGARTGLTVFTDGLQEYEARPDGTVYITLERTFEQVSEPGLPERPGHASWPAPARWGALEAMREYRLAVMLHDPRQLDRRDEIEAAAEAFLVPPTGFMRRALLGPVADVAGPELLGSGLVFSAMKPAESGEGIVLRCYNARGRAVKGRWKLPARVRSAMLCRLDETPREQLRVRRREVEFVAPSRAIVTILVQ